MHAQGVLHSAQAIEAMDLRVLLAMVVLLALIVVALWVRVRGVEEEISAMKSGKQRDEAGR